MRLWQAVVGLSLAVAGAGLPIAQTQTVRATVGDRIGLEGRGADAQGLALWNSGAGAPETAATGHAIPWTTCAATAPYYLATRNHSTLDPASSAGLSGRPPIAGLPGLTDALTVNGFTTAELTLGWSAMSLGDDIEGRDWQFDQTSGVETRRYTGGILQLRLRGEPLVRGTVPAATLTTAYGDLASCNDDQVSLETEVVLLEDDSTTSSTSVAAVATALLGDLDGNGVRILLDQLTPASGAVAGTGRSGSFLEVGSGRLEVAPPCSCDIELSDTDRIHDWTFRWSEASLPTNGPLQMTLTAVTPPTEGGATTPTTAPTATTGRLTLTVFDDSAPSAGAILDVAFPASTGSQSGTLTLDVRPQTDYRVTVTRSGASTDGRLYRLGTSHQGARLGQSGQRYLGGGSQDWLVEAGAGETVTLELSTDPGTDGDPMATTVFVTFADAATGASLADPQALNLVPGAPSAISHVNTGTARDITARIDADGVFRLARVGGGLTALRGCPTRGGLTGVTLDQVQTQVFDIACTRCHGLTRSAGLDLRRGIAHSQLVNVQSGQGPLMRVLPFQPDQSYLVHKIEGRPTIAGTQMPPPGQFPRPGLAQIELVKGWVRSGAPPQ